MLRSRVLDAVAPERFRLTYFGGSTVTFQLADDGQGGTDVSLTEEGLQPEHFKENERGWVSVLLCLQAAADNNTPEGRQQNGRTELIRL